MSPEQIRAAWNAQADEHNRWDALSEDEKLEWALRCAAPPKPMFTNLIEQHPGLQEELAAPQPAAMTPSDLADRIERGEKWAVPPADQSYYCAQCEALAKQLAALKAKPAERSFCPRCGKRAYDGIHTCTPPKETK